MTSLVLDEALTTAAREVLETMFFTTVVDESCENSAQEPPLRVRVCFRGTPSGQFAIEVGAAPARTIAADFLGEASEDLSEAQIRQVVAELANMICGATLSRLDDEKTFDLETPEFVDPEHDPACACVCQSLNLPDGMLKVCLRWDSSSQTDLM